MRDASTDLSRTEFESLPPAVQRKFFSNVERFRLLTAQHLPTHQDDNEQQHLDLAAKRLHSLRHPLTAVSSNRPGAISQQSDRSFQQGTGHKLSSHRIASLTTQAQGKCNAGRPPGRSRHIGIDPTLIHEYLQCFHSLPPKIQKTIFSQEEQQILRRTAPLASNIVDAADWALFRHEERRRASRRRQSLLTDSSSDRAVRPRRRYRRSRSSPPSPAARSSLGPSLTTSLSSIPREEPLEVASRADSTGDPSDSGIEMERTFLDTFRWLDEDEDLDLSLDSYHKYVADAASSSQQARGTTSPRRMPSFRRTLSLAKNRNSLFLGGSRGLSSSQSSTLPFTAASTRVVGGNPRPDAHHTRNLSHRSTSSIDPAAQYYQDPEARLKLRVYLASPQKFDEAIEFGFPSLDKENNDGGVPGRRNVNRDSKRISQISISTHATTHGWTFLDDETTSIDLSLFDLTDRQSSQISPRSPPEKLLPTPCIREVTAPVPISSSTEPRNHRRPQPLKPIGGNADNSHRPAGSGHRREMTLKMTLTRPDLRTVGDAGFLSHDRLDDPLRLAELPPADEACHTIWDDLPAERGVVKKMWRKLRSWKD